MESKLATQKERRNAKRFDVSLLGNSVTSTGRISEIEVTNISSSGLQFDIDQVEMLTLVPNDHQTNRLSPVGIEVNIELPLTLIKGNQVAPIRISCGIVYVRRKTLELCSVGCRFENFIDNASDRLTDYISSIS